MIRFRLKEVIERAISKEGRNPSSSIEWSRSHLRWVERALMEDEPDQDILLENSWRFDDECKVLTRVMRDVVQGT